MLMKTVHSDYWMHLQFNFLLIAGKLSSRENHFIRGERVSHSGMTPLDSLYKSAHPRYPTFPSIYQSKYAHDFQYVPWPTLICKRYFRFYLAFPYTPHPPCWLGLLLGNIGALRKFTVSLNLRKFDKWAGP